MPKPEDRSRIDFRITEELYEVAEDLAKARKFTRANGKPNVSQLMRVLIEEEHARQNGTVGPSTDTRTKT